MNCKTFQRTPGYLYSSYEVFWLGLPLTRSKGRSVLRGSLELHEVRIVFRRRQERTDFHLRVGLSLPHCSHQQSPHPRHRHCPKHLPPAHLARRILHIPLALTHTAPHCHQPPALLLLAMAKIAPRKAWDSGAGGGKPARKDRFLGSEGMRGRRGPYIRGRHRHSSDAIAMRSEYKWVCVIHSSLRGRAAHLSLSPTTPRSLNCMVGSTSHWRVWNMT